MRSELKQYFKLKKIYATESDKTYPTVWNGWEKSVSLEEEEIIGEGVRRLYPCLYNKAKKI